TLSSIRATVHLGAQADAPSHYGSRAPAIDQRDLGYYMGPCQVIRVPVNRGTSITSSLLPSAIRAERVLFATGTYPDPEIFNQDFAALSPELVQHLQDRHVRLIGIDTPS